MYFFYFRNTKIYREKNEIITIHLNLKKNEETLTILNYTILLRVKYAPIFDISIYLIEKKPFILQFLKKSIFIIFFFGVSQKLITVHFKSSPNILYLHFQYIVIC